MDALIRAWEHNQEHCLSDPGLSALLMLLKRKQNVGLGLNSVHPDSSPNSVHSPHDHRPAAAWARLLNAQDAQQGGTALMLICERGSASSARALLQAGAAVDAANQEGSTALAIACVEGQPLLVSELLRSGQLLD